MARLGLGLGTTVGRRRATGVDLLTGLLAYYRFQADGTDSSGNGHDLTTLEGAGFGAGLLANALTSGFLSDSVTIGSFTTFSWSCWWKCSPDLLEFSTGGLFTMRRTAGQPVGGILIAGVAGDAAAQITVGSISLPPVPNDGTWHQVVAVRVGASLTAYLDGVEAGTGVVSGSAATKFDLGVTGDVTTPLDEVGIWDIALSAEQIAALYAAGVGFDPTA